TTLVLVLACSIPVGIALAACSQAIAQVLRVSPQLLGDVSDSILWLSAGLPFVMLSTALFGLLEGFQKFAVTSLVRLPLGVLMFLVPFGVVFFSNHLSPVIAALSAVRVISAVALAAITWRIVPGLRTQRPRFRRDQIRHLLTFGGWLTVSNVIGPVLVYFDRFVIATELGSAAIAFYTVPYDTLNRLLILPTAIQGVLFPAFASLRVQDPSRAAAVFRKSSEKTALLMLPALLGVMLLARQGLQLWLGARFAVESAVVAQVLMIGVFINALARAPFVMVQGYGYARWTALLHLLELPPYAAALWWLLERYGIVGAAIAFTGRIVVDTAILYVMAVRLERGLLATAFRDLAWISAACAASIWLAWVEPALPLRFALLAIVALCSASVLLRDARRVLTERSPAAVSGAAPFGIGGRTGG
ncbi:MAG TPA: flippase, partial [Steroidobacteraceae bacterium]|nr:flippase [Steroidobacteraceae bacterium]